MEGLQTEKRVFHMNYKENIRLYGELYLPPAEHDLPLFILCHGFGSGSHYLRHYGEMLSERGIACLTFDFFGGSDTSKSGGSMMDMTVFDQVEQLSFVVRHMASYEGIDGKRIYIGGESQGGLICGLCAAQMPALIAGQVLLYSATYIPDFLRNKYPDRSKLKEKERLLGLTVSRSYIEEIYDYDPYPVIASYKGPVLIVHGTEDSLVPMEVAERTHSVLTGSTLIRLAGARHGIYGGTYLKQVIGYIAKMIMGI